MLLDDVLNHVSLVVMYIGLVGWLISGFLFVYKGFDRKGRFHFKKGAAFMALTCFFVVVWVAGLTYLSVI